MADHVRSRPNYGVAGCIYIHIHIHIYIFDYLDILDPHDIWFTSLFFSPYEEQYKWLLVRMLAPPDG